MSSFQRPVDQDAFDGVGRVVMQALASLAPGGDSIGVMRKPLETYLVRMYEAVLCRRAGGLQEVLGDMRRARIPQGIIAEVYVPLVARRLGQAWVADTIDFVAVTIGAARLQTLVRQMDGAVEGAARDAQGMVLIGVPEGVQHTLGATVLAGHMRSRGFAVRLDLELTPAGIAEHVGKRACAGVFLSISQQDQVETFRKLIETSKRASRDTPVVIGGALLVQDNEIVSAMGADLATCDVDEAIRQCRMPEPAVSVPLPMHSFADVPLRAIAGQRGLGK